MDLCKGGGVFKRKVRQAEWPLALRLNEVLPGLPQLTIGRLDLSSFENSPIISSTKHRTMIGDEALRTPRG